MKFIIRTVFFFLFLLPVTNVSGQNKLISFGIKGGVNFSNFGGDMEDTKVKPGYHLGVLMDAKLTLDAYLLTGLELTAKGAKHKDQSVDTEAIYVQMPIHIGYRMSLSNVTSLAFHAGPYVAYGIGGKMQGADGKINTFSNAGYKSFDFGLGLGVGAEFSHFGIEGGYDLGVVNISRVEDQKVRMMNIFLSLNYRF